MGDTKADRQRRRGRFSPSSRRCGRYPCPQHCCPLGVISLLTTAKGKSKGKTKGKTKGKAKVVPKVRKFKFRGEENLPNSASLFSFTRFLGAKISKKRINVFVDAIFQSWLIEKSASTFSLMRFLRSKYLEKCVNVFVDALFVSNTLEKARQRFR